jgi:hypothetical protein
MGMIVALPAKARWASLDGGKFDLTGLTGQLDGSPGIAILNDS